MQVLENGIALTNTNRAEAKDMRIKMKKMRYFCKMNKKIIIRIFILNPKYFQIWISLIESHPSL